VLLAVKNFSEAIFSASNRLKSDKEIALAALKVDACSFQYISQELHKDRDILLMAIEDRKNFKLLPPNIKTDLNFIMACFEKNPNNLCYFNLSQETYESLIEMNPKLILHVPKGFNLNSKICLNAIQNGLNLAYLPKEYQNDKEIILQAIERNPKDFEIVSMELKNDKEFCLSILGIDGNCLEWISDELKNDKEIVETAVRKSPESWIFASEEIKYLGKSTKYKVIEKMAAGGEAVIFKVQHKDKFYAEKRIFIDDINQLNDYISQFIKIQQFQNRNVFEIVEIIQDVNDILGICILRPIMKLYTCDLMNFISKKYPQGIKDYGLLVNFAIQLTNGLLFLHKNGIIHRDLKPENIFLDIISDDEIVLKIGDFGTSMKEKEKQMFGSLMYIAPEIMNYASFHNEKSDVFSLGGLFHRMAFNEEKFFYVACAQGNNFDFGVDAHFSFLIKRMLEFDPSKRIDLEQVLEELMGMSL
jgi:tRNA A-37 threonylcarbamoyl transferase component Bud32